MPDQLRRGPDDVLIAGSERPAIAAEAGGRSCRGCQIAELGDRATFEEVGPGENGIVPNVSVHSGNVYDPPGLPVDLSTPMTATSLAADCVAHVDECPTDNRLVRSRSRDVRPDGRSFLELDQQSTE
jgi:citrate synthase